jgi:hypothetical protein
VVGEVRWPIVNDDTEWGGGVCWAKGRKRTESAEAPTTIGMSIVASCGNLDRERWVARWNIGSRESLDDAHRPTAIGANPKIARTVGGSFLRGFGWRAEQGEAEWQCGGAPAIGKLTIQPFLMCQHPGRVFGR